MPLQILDSLVVAFRIRKYIRAAKPSVVISNSMKAHVLVFLSLAWLRNNYILHLRDRVTVDFMNRIGISMIKLVARVAADGIIANSNATLETVPHAHVRTAVIASPAAVPGIISRELPQSEKFTFAVVGRITPWKGQELALASFRDVQAKYPGAKLRFIGDALFGEEGYRDQLKIKVSEMSLEHSVFFDGHVNDVYGSLAKVNCLVHSSIIPEPFGQVIVQGMAMGLPVIAAREGGPMETIQHRENGILYEPRNAAALSAAMFEIIENKVLASEIGRNALAESAKYAPAILAVKYEEFISVICDSQT
ncbi:glycosyltransferase [Williamsia herbipolensis]|uniref:Glycosyltransferase n=1 Tax=Williamsia herbipolensis TaxID=1603258 RepID=A0AAU4K764_9NOCA|nr:glycosyltransferase [Williamsia herbipolensis]